MDATLSYVHVDARAALNVAKSSNHIPILARRERLVPNDLSKIGLTQSRQNHVIQRNVEKTKSQLRRTRIRQQLIISQSALLMTS
jgi:hypothetical protein